MGILSKKTKLKTSEEPKKKKALWKRILKWTGISFFLLLCFLIAVPFIFKGKIIRMAKAEVNNQLNAVVDFDEDNIDITFISTFPEITVTFHDITVDGVDQFEGVRLAEIGSFSASLDVKSVIFDDKIQVHRIAIDRANIHIMVLEDGSANYDITKPDSAKADLPEEESNFQLALDAYSITNSNVIYDDKYYVTYVELNNFNHSGSGNFTSDVFKFVTKTSAETMTFGYDGIKYLTRVNTDIDAEFDIDMSKDLKLAFRNNKIRLNNLNLNFSGDFTMADEYYDMNFDFAAEKAGFKEFLSLIPVMYASDFAGMTINGDLEFDGKLNGKYSDTSMPGFDVHLKIGNGYVKYADLPEALQNINIDTRISRDEGLDFDNTVIDVKRFGMLLAGNKIDAVLNVVNPISDPGIKCSLNADVNLASVSRFYPFSAEESLSGRLKADMELAGRLSAIEQEKYEQFKAEGTLTAGGLKYRDGADEYLVDSLLFKFSPQFLDMPILKASGMDIDLVASGKINNYLGYFFRSELLKGEFNVAANRINADKFMESESNNETGSASAPETEPEPGVPMEPFVIPANIDFLLHTSVNELVYNAIPMRNVKGDIHVKDGVANLKGLNMQVFGGTVGLSGSYDTRNPIQPLVDFSYNIKELDIKELTGKFATVDRLAPMLSKCTGRISSDFTMNGALGKDMMPLYSTLTGGGDLKSKSIYIEGFEPLNKLASEMKINRLAKQTINDVKMFFEFKDGRVNVKPYTVRLANIPTTVSGYTAFDETIGYDMEMRVPKSEIPKPIIEAAEKALGQAATLGIKLNELPAEIPVKIKITGTARNPKVETNFKEQILSLTGNLKDQIKDQIKEKIDEKIEEVKEKVEEKIEEVKEDVKAKVEQIMQDAQRRADEVKAEAKRLADMTRAEGEKQAQAIEDAAKNPIEKQAAKAAAKKVRDEANKKADAIELEAGKKADAIMTEARKKTDELEKK